MQRREILRRRTLTTDLVTAARPGDHRGVVVGVLAVLVVVAWFARRTVGHPVLSRLRALVPAWRFFDRVRPSPYLVIRWAAPGAALGAWVRIDGGPREARSWAFAPRANLRLAHHAAVEQLVAELADVEVADREAAADPDTADTDPAIVDRVSYRLVSRIARTHVPAALRDRPGARFQWKLTAPGDTPDQAESLVSGELAA
jgi:hypothetical protein